MSALSRPRVVPGDRWDDFEISDVIREQTSVDRDLVPWLYQKASTNAIPEVTEWADDLVRQAIAECEVAARGYPTVRHGRSLVLFGTTGTGKTHAAYGAMCDLVSSGVRVRWCVVSASKLFDRLRPRHGVDSEDEFERYATAGVLAVDDLGAHKASEWQEEKLTRLIDERYMHGRPTLYISNLTQELFDVVVGERVASRLAECATEVVVAGPDRRRSAEGAR